MRLEIKKMATFMFVTLCLDISRTSWHMKVSDGSFFCKFHALSFEPNLCRTRNSPLSYILQIKQTHRGQDSRIKQENQKSENKKNKEWLITKREALKTEALSAKLNWKPEFGLIDGAFNGAYRRYRIDQRPRMDVETFFNRIG